MSCRLVELTEAVVKTTIHRHQPIWRIATPDFGASAASRCLFGIDQFVKTKIWPYDLLGENIVCRCEYRAIRSNEVSIFSSGAQVLSIRGFAELNWLGMSIQDRALAHG